jgi:hypothetical protein
VCNVIVSGLIAEAANPERLIFHRTSHRMSPSPEGPDPTGSGAPAAFAVGRSDGISICSMARSEANLSGETGSLAPPTHAGSPTGIPDSSQQQRYGDIDPAECGQHGEGGTGFVHGVLATLRFFLASRSLALIVHADLG